MKFKNIIGHRLIKQRFKNMARDKRIPHSLLFTGSEGIGKRLTAFSLGAYINCRSRQKNRPCLKCISCKRVLNGSHPLIRFIGSPKKEPHIVLNYGSGLKIRFNNMVHSGRRRSITSGKDKPAEKNKNNQISKTVKINIDQIRELKKEANHKPYIDGKKIFIIDDVAQASGEALNGILKVLEEPPGSTYFILITFSPRKLLPTVHSRCQTVEFSPLTDRQMENFINKKVDKKLNKETAEKLIDISDGSPGKFLKFLDIEEFISDNINITDFFKVISKQFSDREESIEKLNMLLKKEGVDFNRSPGEKKYRNIKVMEKAIRDLNKNANITLTVSNMFLKLGLTDI